MEESCLRRTFRPRRGFGALDEGQKCRLCCLSVVLFVGMILFASSFGALELNTLGLRKGKISRSYDTSLVYEPGRYFIGIDQEFVDFDMTWQSLDFCNGCNDGPPISAKAAKEGGSPVTVLVDVHMFYKLNEARLNPLINKFPTKNWHTLYTTVAKNAIIQTIQGDLDVDFLLQDRDTVARMFAIAITKAMQQTYAYVTTLYLGQIKLEAQIDQAFMLQWIKNRDGQTLAIDGEREKLQQETEALISEQAARTRVLLSEQYFLGNTTIARRRSEGQQLLLEAEGVAYADMKTNLTFTENNLLQFIYTDRIRNSRESLVAGFADNTKLVRAAR